MVVCKICKPWGTIIFKSNRTKSFERKWQSLNFLCFSTYLGEDFQSEYDCKQDLLLLFCLEASISGTPNSWSNLIHLMSLAISIPSWQRDTDGRKHVEKERVPKDRKVIHKYFHRFSIISWKIAIIHRWNVPGALHSPKGMLTIGKSSVWALKGVFSDLLGQLGSENKPEAIEKQYIGFLLVFRQLGSMKQWK
ncbi:hypothetical protein Tco_0071386 [Tanacetum coccineum]